VTGRTRSRLSGSRGQALLEFALTLPVLLLVVLGLVEAGWALLDYQVVTRITREGSNLISRDASLQDAASAMRSMATSPVDFDSSSKLIFSVIKRGGAVGTANYDKLVLYQRYEFGSGSGVSKLNTLGTATFGGAPDYLAPNSDTNTPLQLTDVPNELVTVPGGMAYVTEVYSTHELITPLDNFGITMPQQLYSIAYF
jgi:hypothetical protein